MKPPAWAIRTKADEEALRQGAVWVQAEADKVIRFAEAFTKPQYYSGPFRLMEWQRQLLASIYAWRWPSGRRVKRFVNLHIAKKNGKTLITSIVAMVETFLSGEPSPYVCAAAASKENASQIFKELRHSIEAGPFNSYCRIQNHVKRITVPSLNAEFRTFASIGSRVHGEPTSACILDECHAIGDPELYRAMRYNCAARASGGLICAISTAGSDTSHFYHQQIYSKSKRVLAGEDLDTSWLAYVYEADKNADLEKDESQWHKANPSLGTAFSLADFRQDLTSARENLGEWLNFKRLRLNIWVRPDDNAYFGDLSDWERFKREYTDDELKSCESVIGVDLSEVGDPTSVSQVYDMGDGTYYIKSKCWVAQDAVAFRNKGVMPKFDDFIEEKSMIVTDGDMIDRDAVRDYIIKLCQAGEVRQVNFDPHSAYVMAMDVENEGYSTARMVQSAKNFNVPMLEFARAYKEGRIFHDGSTWLKYCLSNVRVDINKYGEVRPFKRRCLDHIDGAVSTLLAFSTIFTSEQGGSGFILLEG
jgi:phage terminase large subunit-like protein